MAAVNLAVMRSMPLEVVTYPTIWVLLGTCDFVVFWKLIAKRSFQGFHYTFLIVFVVTYIDYSARCLDGATESARSPRPVVPNDRGREHDRELSGYLWIAEFWTACFLSFVLAYTIGAVAAWLERCRGWDIAAFWRGAFVGFGVFTVLMLIADAAARGAQPSSAQLIGRLVILAVCLILGGWLGLSRMKSSQMTSSKLMPFAPLLPTGAPDRHRLASEPRARPRVGTKWPWLSSSIYPSPRPT